MHEIPKKSSDDTKDCFQSEKVYLNERVCVFGLLVSTNTKKDKVKFIAFNSSDIMIGKLVPLPKIIF